MVTALRSALPPMQSDAPESFDDFCRRVHLRLVGALAYHCGDRSLAEDLAQETLARACRDWAKVREAPSPEAWTYRVAFNLASSWFRRVRVAGRPHALRPSQADGDLDAALAVRAAVTALPRRQREAIILRYFGDLSVADASAAMGCAAGTVRALTAQALDSLRAALGSDGWKVDDDEPA